VMSIMHVYIAPADDVSRRCKPLPTDRKQLEKYKRVRTEPPNVAVPLNAVRPNGRTYIVKTPADGARRLKKRATVVLRSGRFRPAHISVALNARVTWRFNDPIAHNVLLASGPTIVGAPTLSHGATKSSQFRKPGRYELFCYLHPMTMHQVVDVRPPPPA